MTLNDIKNEVSALSFLGEIPLDNSFVFSVARALRCIYSERGVIEALSLYQSSPRTHTSLSGIRVSPSDNLEYTLPRGTFSLYIGGKGIMKINSGSEQRAYPFTEGCEHITGYVDKEFTMSFSSEYSFSIHSLFHTEECINTSMLPSLTGMMEYRLRDIAEDFLSADGAPTDEYGRCIKGSKIISEALFIPYDYEGVVSLEYKKAPPSVNIDYPNEELSVPCELVHLIPLLTASYVILDDDEERAAYYLSLYKSEMARLKSDGKVSLSNTYTDRLGWC